jgi:hypothetical protein
VGTYVLAASASDAGGVREVTFRVDGSVVGTDQTAPYQYGWNSAATPDGSHTLTAVATDVAGNATVSSPVVVTVANGSAQPPPPPPPPPPGPSSGIAELPRVWLNTAYSPPGGRTVRVPAGGDLQAALNAAQPGDILLLAAGATYTDNFVLPAKSGSGWIVITTETSLPPEGTRVSPASASNFAKILTPNYGPAIEAAPGAKRYRIMGVEVSATASVPEINALIRYGAETPDLAQLPREIILDRAYVHGTPTLELRRCVDMNAAAAAVIDSYVSDCHSRGSDSQAVGGWSTPGPIKITNNYLEGAGENVMFGGGDPASAAMVPADLEIVGNDIVKPAAWFQSGRWTVKNLFEIKTATRVLIERNTFDGSWLDAQTGFAIILKSVNQSGGFGDFSKATDITFRRNVIRNATHGVTLATDPEGGQVAEKLSRVVIEDNRFERMGAESPYSKGEGGRLWMILDGPIDAVIRHNTYAGGGLANQVLLDGVLTRFVFENNIIGPSEYGFQNAHALDQMTPGAIIRGNILAPATWNNLLPAGNCIAWPPGGASACPSAGVR